MRPWPPTPMMATFTLSLGATNPGPPRTWRGRIVAAATADAAVVMNWRRLDSEVCFRLMAFPFGAARVPADRARASYPSSLAMTAAHVRRRADASGRCDPMCENRRTLALERRSFSPRSCWPRPCAFRLSPRARCTPTRPFTRTSSGPCWKAGATPTIPAEYHGPTLYYLTLLPAWLRGEQPVRGDRRGHPALRSRRARAWLSSPPTSGREASWAPPAPRSRPSWPRSPRPWSSTAGTSSTRPRSSSSASARCSRPAGTCGHPAPPRPSWRARARG